MIEDADVRVDREADGHVDQGSDGGYWDSQENHDARRYLDWRVED